MISSRPWAALKIVRRLAGASSRGRTTAILAAIAIVGTPLGAQGAPTPAERDSARAASDSMAARLRRAEQAIAILQQQIAEQASSGVATRSRMQLELNGRVLVHASRNNRRVNNADDPQFARPDSGPNSTPFVFSARQTTLGAVLTANDVLGGRFTGDVDVDFYGGQQPSSGGRTFPLLRLRTARGAIRWPNGEVMAGQEQPLIAGQNPVSPAAIGTPLFAAAGNLWLWLPQVRASVHSSGAIRFGAQAAALANITGDAVGLFDTEFDQAERSGRPSLEGRLHASWGEDEAASDIGCGGHVGWIDLAFQSSVRTSAAACDGHVRLASRLEVRGEIYEGRGLRGLGGGGIGQNLNRFGAPLNDRGGWAQLNVDANSVFRLGAGCGIDQARTPDVTAAGRLRNQSCAVYSIARPSGPLFIGAEVRQIETRNASGAVTNYHLNLAMGFEF